MYELIKAAVTARQAAESFGLTVNRSGMAACPFHEDHTPSLKLDQRYYCFGCGAAGDVIDFTSQLLNVSNYNAAQILAERFGIQPELQTVITPKIYSFAILGDPVWFIPLQIFRPLQRRKTPEMTPKHNSNLKGGPRCPE